MEYLETQIKSTGHIKPAHGASKSPNSNGGKIPPLESAVNTPFLIDVVSGHYGGTYAHYLPALSYAQYLSNELHSQVSSIFIRWYGADVTLIDDIYERATAEEKKWIAARIKGKEARSTYTDTLQVHNVVGEGFGICSNKIYLGLFNKTAKQIAYIQQQALMTTQQKKLAKATSIRDRMTREEISQVDFAETLACHWINCKNSQGTNECAAESFTAAQEIAALWKRNENNVAKSK